LDDGREYFGHSAILYHVAVSCVVGSVCDTAQVDTAGNRWATSAFSLSTDDIESLFAIVCEGQHVAIARESLAQERRAG
jgi:hypothetical protein